MLPGMGRRYFFIWKGLPLPGPAGWSYTRTTWRFLQLVCLFALFKVAGWFACAMLFRIHTPTCLQYLPAFRHSRFCSCMSFTFSFFPGVAWTGCLSCTLHIWQGTAHACLCLMDFMRISSFHVSMRSYSFSFWFFILYFLHVFYMVFIDGVPGDIFFGWYHPEQFEIFPTSIVYSMWSDLTLNCEGDFTCAVTIITGCLATFVLLALYWRRWHDLTPFSTHSWSLMARHEYVWELLNCWRCLPNPLRPSHHLASV